MDTGISVQESESLGDQTTIILPDSMFSKPGRMRLEFGAETHVGKVRSKNEDHYLIARARKSLDILTTSLHADQLPDKLEQHGHVVLLADGLGGHAVGEHASAIVVNEAMQYIMQTAKWFFRLDDPDEEVRLRLLREALSRVDRRLREEAEHDFRLRGMGTTLTAATIVDADVFLVHVGDSRAYLLHDGRLEQLTTDHTLVQEMVTRGHLSPEEAKTHHLRHVITNVLGASPGVEGEVHRFRLCDGDRLLLCTDGLTEPVPDAQIAEILRQAPDPQAACHGLVQAALDHGGPDNITTIVAHCVMATDGS